VKDFTRYDSLGRTIATTTWLTPRGAIDPLSPPIAGLNNIPFTDGLTTQYLYDDNLADGTGLDSSTGVSPAILPAPMTTLCARPRRSKVDGVFWTF
jgi:hypothetical protein